MNEQNPLDDFYAFEWTTRRGSHKGSSCCCGCAVALALIIVAVIVIAAFN